MDANPHANIPDWNLVDENFAPEDFDRLFSETQKYFGLTEAQALNFVRYHIDREREELRQIRARQEAELLALDQEMAELLRENLRLKFLRARLQLGQCLAHTRRAFSHTQSWMRRSSALRIFIVVWLVILLCYEVFAMLIPAVWLLYSKEEVEWCGNQPFNEVERSAQGTHGIFESESHKSCIDRDICFLQ
ncbi:hypothetical protein CBOM_01066 [Ceraceosorus bombacis]|uniref:Uncharacterized protein n=1 Tax=Ceraceosorus bombacis TaxID=401625 RepID=A0A0P1BBN2_9BASI|nr:hypothetical protein CBOM_01066 [Ceraceosorus bombacis]